MDVAPLYTRINPMTMTETAAARSPRNLTLKESREAESPVRKRAGTVPRPKANIVRKPPRRLCMVAAFMIMAQESMQGKKPVRNPNATLDAGEWDRSKEEAKRVIRDAGAAGRPVVEKGRGRTPQSTKPSRTIRIPPLIARVERRPEKNLLKPARWARAAANAPSRPYVRTRPRWKER